MSNRLQRSWARLDAWLRRASPRTAGDYIARGLDRHLRADLAGAIADYDQAIARYTDRYSQALAYLTRGNARQDQGDLASAIADYDQAIARHPGYAAAYLNRGLAHEEMEQAEQAAADYRQLLELTTFPYWRRQARARLSSLGTGDRAATGELGAASGDGRQFVETVPGAAGFRECLDPTAQGGSDG